MAKIAITFVDQDDGLVDIQVFIDGLVEGQPATEAQKLSMFMMTAAKDRYQNLYNGITLN